MTFLQGVEDQVGDLGDDTLTSSARDHPRGASER
jgi:hypothetical protein